MKEKTYLRWIDKRVRLRPADPHKPPDWIGTIVAPARFNTWWFVEWPDGSRKMYPLRQLEEVNE